MFTDESIARALQDRGLINPQQLAEARKIEQGNGIGLLNVMVGKNMVAGDTVITALSLHLGMHVVDLKQTQVNFTAVSLIPQDYAQSHEVLAVAFDPAGSLVVAIRNPDNLLLSNTLTAMTGCQVRFVFAIGGSLRELIDLSYARPRR